MWLYILNHLFGSRGQCCNWQTLSNCDGFIKETSLYSIPLHCFLSGVPETFLRLFPNMQNRNVKAWRSYKEWRQRVSVRKGLSTKDGDDRVSRGYMWMPCSKSPQGCLGPGWTVFVMPMCIRVCIHPNHSARVLLVSKLENRRDATAAGENNLLSKPPGTKVWHSFRMIYQWEARSSLD